MSQVTVVPSFKMLPAFGLIRPYIIMRANQNESIWLEARKEPDAIETVNV